MQTVHSIIVGNVARWATNQRLEGLSWEEVRQALSHLEISNAEFEAGLNEARATVQ